MQAAYASNLAPKRATMQAVNYATNTALKRATSKAAYVYVSNPAPKIDLSRAASKAAYAANSAKKKTDS